MSITYVHGIIRTNYNTVLQQGICNFILVKNEYNRNIRQPVGRVFDNNEVDIIKHGICTLISMYWLIRVRKCEPSRRGDVYRKFATRDDIVDNEDHFKKLAEFFWNYQIEMGQISANNSIHIPALLGLENRYLEECNRLIGGRKGLCVNTAVKHEEVYKILHTSNAQNNQGYRPDHSAKNSKVWEYDEKRKYRLVRLCFSNGKGHRIAMYYESRRLVYVFDPNMGTIKVEKPMREALENVLFDVVDEIADGVRRTIMNNMNIQVEYHIIDTLKT